MNPQPQQVQIKADDATLKGTYSNGAQVQFQKEEFIIDFMSSLPPVPSLVSRVIVSPGHAKRLAIVLAETVKRYEAKHGPITVGEAQSQEIGFATK